jgi:transglutaminase-like putative cysteine protease
MDFKKYLEETDIINYSHPKVEALAKKLAKDCKDDEQIAKNCFLFVRDEIRHTGDFRDNIATLSASEVLEAKTGWCYAKAHLLAALLRANGIPAGIIYQRLSHGERESRVFYLHALNEIYLKNLGWYKADPRGNKEGVDAQFIPPVEKLAFELKEGESMLQENFHKPLDVVVEALQNYKTFDTMIQNLPDKER